jgi:hypothetical protein
VGLYEASAGLMRWVSVGTMEPRKGHGPGAGRYTREDSIQMMVSGAVPGPYISVGGLSILGTAKWARLK